MRRTLFKSSFVIMKMRKLGIGTARNVQARSRLVLVRMLKRNSRGLNWLWRGKKPTSLGVEVPSQHLSFELGTRLISVLCSGAGLFIIWKHNLASVKPSSARKPLKCKLQRPNMMFCLLQLLQPNSGYVWNFLPLNPSWTHWSIYWTDAEPQRTHWTPVYRKSYQKP